MIFVDHREIFEEKIKRGVEYKLDKIASSGVRCAIIQETEKMMKGKLTT